MRPLPATVILHPDEACLSFCSRLASANGAASMRDFCRHMGINWEALARGETAALDRLALLGGVDSSLLHRRSLRGGPDSRELGGQKLLRNLVRSPDRLFVCPKCIADDIDNGDGPEPRRPYLRTAWLSFAARACPVHRVRIVPLGPHMPKYVSSDIVTLVRHLAPEIRKECEILPRQSDFDAYVHGRLNGTGHERNEFLESLPFHVAFRLAEVIGAQILFSPDANLKDLTDDDLWNAGRCGYKVTRRGAEGLQDFLSFLSDRPRRERPDAGGGPGDYGKLYHWLNQNRSSPDFAQLCASVRDHAVNRLPLGPGDEFLGAVTSRRWHSIQSAAKQFGIHPKPLRKYLVELRLLPPSTAPLSDNQVLFDAAKANHHLEVLSHGLLGPAAQAAANVPRVTWDLLVRHKVVKPAIERTRHNQVYHVFAKPSIDEFLRKLTTPVGRPPADQEDVMSIVDAVRHARCSAVDAVRLILEGKMDFVGTNPIEAAFEGVRISAAELRRRTESPGHGGYSLREVEKRLQTTTGTARALVTRGHLPSEKVVNPVSRFVQTIVRPNALEAFIAEYVSLSVLASERKTQIAVLRRELEASGIRPAFDLGSNARFYRRSSVRNHADCSAAA